MFPKIDKPREKTMENIDAKVEIYINHLKTKYSKDLQEYWFLNNSWSLLRILRARDFDI